MTDSTFDQALEIALSLSPRERLQLIERVASSVEQEIEPSLEVGKHWGEALVSLVESLDLLDWEAMDINDPLEWVRRQREEEEQHRLGDWGSQ
jgi:hypothetical protein